MSGREHVAVVCPICGTVQSMASLIKAGCQPDKVETMIGFSCEGRLTDAGPAASGTDKSRKAVKRRAVRGCDWTLGGLFKLHRLEVITPEGEAAPTSRWPTPTKRRNSNGP